MKIIIYNVRFNTGLCLLVLRNTNITESYLDKCLFPFEGELIPVVLSYSWLILPWEWASGLLGSSAFCTSVFCDREPLGFGYAIGSFAGFDFKYATFCMENPPIFVSSRKLSRSSWSALSIALSFQVPFQYISIPCLTSKYVLKLYISYCIHYLLRTYFVFYFTFYYTS